MQKDTDKIHIKNTWYPFLSLPIFSYPFLSLPIPSYPFLFFPIHSYPFLSLLIPYYFFLSLPISSYSFFALQKRDNKRFVPTTIIEQKKKGHVSLFVSLPRKEGILIAIMVIQLLRKANYF